VRFLADESCDGRVVRALSAAGHEVRLAVTDLRGEPDEAVSDAAAGDERVLITEDLDFGRLAFLERRTAIGVLLLRWPASDRDGLARATVEHVASLGARLIGAFTVLRPGGIRIRRLDTP
jgi:predicted nuclease of predicted toxin-antitoxin system